MDDIENKKTGRHDKMFDLLRKGDLREEPEERAAATTARYLDDDAAQRFLMRGMSSLKPQPTLESDGTKAATRTAPFAPRQAD